MRVHQRLTGIFLAGFLALAACGSTNEATTTDQPTTDQPTTDQLTATDQPTAATESSETGPTGLGLAAILLRVDDLPAGWSEVPVTDDEGDACLDELFGPEGPFDPDEGVNAAFGASEIGPFLVAWVVDGSTSHVLADVSDVLVSCDGTTGPSGFTTTIDATPVSGLPDDSLSAHGVDENADGSRINFVVAGAGTDQATVLVFSATPLGEINDEVVAIAVNAMVDRIPGA